MKVITAIVFATVSTGLLNLHSTTAAQTTNDKEGAIQTFVQDFYNWYLPNARNPHVDALQLALKDRRSAFSPKMVKGLKDVEAAAERDQDPGLDFDPILNNQDPGDPGDPPYEVGAVTGDAGRYRVDVFWKSKGRKREKIVVPELQALNGHFIFVNFHYPNSSDPRNENLLTIIKIYLERSPSK